MLQWFSKEEMTVTVGRRGGSDYSSGSRRKNWLLHYVQVEGRCVIESKGEEVVVTEVWGKGVVGGMGLRGRSGR